MTGPVQVVAVVPAKDEAQRLAATLRALAGVPGVGQIVVVDDGSTDDTSGVARSLAAGEGEDGAEVPIGVVRHPRNRGKAAAMTTGAVEAGRIDPRAALLFVDADLEDSAANLGPLVAPVLAGDADMSIATLPPQKQPGGGFGLVVGVARNGIERLTGWAPVQPLSGMRALTRTAFDRALPLASGWGVEVGLTVDVVHASGRVVEVPVELHHRVTGRDLRAQLHRARQYRDVWLALAHRGAWGFGRPGS